MTRFIVRSRCSFRAGVATGVSSNIYRVYRGNGWSKPLKQNRTNAFRNTVENIINQMFYQRAEEDRRRGGERVGQGP